MGTSLWGEGHSSGFRSAPEIWIDRGGWGWDVKVKEALSTYKEESQLQSHKHERKGGRGEGSQIKGASRRAEDAGLLCCVTILRSRDGEVASGNPAIAAGGGTCCYHGVRDEVFSPSSRGILCGRSPCRDRAQAPRPKCSESAFQPTFGSQGLRTGSYLCACMVFRHLSGPSSFEFWRVLAGPLLSAGLCRHPAAQPRASSSGRP